MAAMKVKESETSSDWNGQGDKNRLGHLLLADTGSRTPSDKILKSSDWKKAVPVDFESYKYGIPLSTAGNMAYADGSKNYDGTCSFGVVVRKEGVHDHPLTEEGLLGFRSSTLQAETYTIHRAAATLLALNVTAQTIIFSDSKQALNSLSRNATVSKTLLKCRVILHDLTLTCDLKLRLVKAHAGHELNELVRLPG